MAIVNATRAKQPVSKTVSGQNVQLRLIQNITQTSVTDSIISRIHELGIYRKPIKSTYRGKRAVKTYRYPFENQNSADTYSKIPVRVTNRNDVCLQTKSCRDRYNLIQCPTTKYDLPIILSTNLQSFNSKANEIELFANSILCFTETFYNSEIPNDCTYIPGYATIRRDRNNGKRGGGVMCAIEEGMPYKRWTDLENDNFETLWFTLRPYKMPRQFYLTRFITLQVIKLGTIKPTY